MTNIVIIKSKKKDSLIFALSLGIWRVFFPKERREVNVVGEVEEEFLVGLVKVQHRVLICTLFGPDIFKLLDEARSLLCGSINELGEVIFHDLWVMLKLMPALLPILGRLLQDVVAIWSWRFGIMLGTTCSQDGVWSLRSEVKLILIGCQNIVVFKIYLGSKIVLVEGCVDFCFSISVQEHFGYKAT